MNKIFTFDNIFNNNECNYLIEKINNKKNVVNFSDNGFFKNDKFKNINLANKIYNTIPNNIKKELNFLRPNDLIMTGMYKPGDKFGLHTDTGLYYNKEKKEKSNFTYLVYLNDNFEGGETEFYKNNFDFYLSVKPKKASGLLFDISYWHKGNEVISGEKFWIGIEIITKF